MPLTDLVHARVDETVASNVLLGRGMEGVANANGEVLRRPYLNYRLLRLDTERNLLAAIRSFCGFNLFRPF